jgi:hypothetical protein
MTTRMSDADIAACCRRFAVAVGLIGFAVTAPMLASGTWSSRAIATDAASAVDRMMFAPAHASDTGTLRPDVQLRIDAAWAIEREHSANRRATGASRTMLAMN